MAGAVITNYGALLEEAGQVLRTREKASTISIQVGSATCEDAAGANEVFEEFRKHIAAAGSVATMWYPCRTASTSRATLRRAIFRARSRSPHAIDGIPASFWSGCT